MMLLTIAGIWIVLALVSVTAIYLIREVNKIKHGKLDQEEFLEYIEAIYKEKQKERKLP